MLLLQNHTCHLFHTLTLLHNKIDSFSKSIIHFIVNRFIMGGDINEWMAIKKIVFSVYCSYF